MILSGFELSLRDDDILVTIKNMNRLCWGGTNVQGDLVNNTPFGYVLCKTLLIQATVDQSHPVL